MTQEEKDLLLKDLSARLRYGVFLNIGNYSDYILQGIVNSDTNKPLIVRCEGSNFNCSIEIVKPCLRPMSSMTEEEKEKLKREFCIDIQEEDNGRHTETYGYITIYHDFNGESWYIPFEAIDWLNAHHFDYRGLIEKGLALEAPEGMYEKWTSLRGNLKEDTQGNIVGGLKL